MAEKTKLDLAREVLAKRYGVGATIQGTEILNVERLSTGSLGLDVATGGGYGRGRIVEIYAPESTGKTTLAIHAMIEAQKIGGTVAFVDAEHCLSGDMLVYNPTKNTNISCKELYNKGEEFDVLSYKNGGFVPQKAIIKKTGVKDLLKISLSTGAHLKITHNHEVLTQEGYKKVESLVVGDVMYSPYEIPRNGGQGEEDLDLFFLLGFYLGDGTRLSDSTVTPNIANIDEKTLAYIGTIVGKYGCTLKKDGEYNYRITNSCPTLYDFNVKDILAKFNAGWSLKELTNYLKVTHATIRRLLLRNGVKKDYDFRKHASEIRSKKRSPYNEISEKTTKLEYTNPITAFLRGYDECLLPHKNLTTPPLKNSDQVRYFLAGLIVADGTVVDVDKNHRASLSISTSSRNFAKDIQSLLLQFAIESAVTDNYKEGYDTNYKVTINGVNNLTKLHTFIPLISYKKDRLEKALSSVGSLSRSTIADNLKQLEIVEIEKLPHQEEVFDISVKNNNYEHQNFICENVVVHNCFDKNYAAAVGLEIEKLIISQPDSGEQALEIASTLIETGMVTLLVVDSVAALTPQAEIDGEMGESKMGLHARLMSQALRKLTASISRTNTVVIFINQLREKIGVVYGSNEITTGGNALKFYASQRIDLRKKAGHKNDDGHLIDNLVTAKVVKNKLASPFRTCEFDLVYGKGISRESEVCKLGVEGGFIKKAGSWYSYGEVKLGQGESAVKQLLEDNPELSLEIENKIRVSQGLPTVK